VSRAPTSSTRPPEVRDHVIRFVHRLVADHAWDGLKIDFLDEAMAYRGDGPHAITKAPTSATSARP